jgi:hypothetical protein
MKDSRLRVVFVNSEGKKYPIDMVPSSDIFKGIKKLIAILDERLYAGTPD